MLHSFNQNLEYSQQGEEKELSWNAAHLETDQSHLFGEGKELLLNLIASQGKSNSSVHVHHFINLSE